MKDPILTIELVPRTCWWSNVRSSVSKKDWDTIRKESYKLAGHKCEICGGKGSKHPVECHEVWHYDDEKKVQTLLRMIALCPSCHEVKHFGLANLKGRDQEAKAHLMKVNKWDSDTAEDYIGEQFELWRQRSSFAWKLDISWLEQKGIEWTYDGKR